MTDEKVRQALEDFLSRVYPNEKLKESLTAMERPNLMLIAFLLGPLGLLATRFYYLGLTDKRIVLIALNRLTNQPTQNVSQILLERIEKIEQTSDLGNPVLIIHCSDNVKRRLTVVRQKQNAAKFVELFHALQKPI